MSRKSHHPIRRHVRPRHPDAKRPGTSAELPVGAEPMEPGTLAEPAAEVEREVERESAAAAAVAVAEPDPEELVPPADEPAPVLAPPSAAEAEPEPEPIPALAPTEPAANPAERSSVPAQRPPAEPVASVVPPVGPPSAATAPQLRRFIKSRSYIPMHELRRRFGIVVEDDDVAQIDLGTHRVYVGLPRREGDLLGELLRAGDIGYSASFDPVTPVIVGVFPIRPVTRG